MVLVERWPFFQLFFRGNKGQENVFYDILERKNAFLVCTNKKFKNSKNWHFFKGIKPWFRSKKWPDFQRFYLREKWPGKCLLGYSRTKKRLSRLQKQQVQKSKNWHFSKGVNPWLWSKYGHFSNFSFEVI